jgi:hypothetical protein
MSNDKVLVIHWFSRCSTVLANGREMVGADSVNAYYDPKLKEARIELLKRDPKFPTDAKLVHAAIKEGSSLAASTALSCGNRIRAPSNAPRQPSPRPRLAEDTIAPNPAALWRLHAFVFSTNRPAGRMPIVGEDGTLHPEPARRTDFAFADASD